MFIYHIFRFYFVIKPYKNFQNEVANANSNNTFSKANTPMKRIEVANKHKVLSMKKYVILYDNITGKVLFTYLFLLYIFIN